MAYIQMTVILQVSDIVYIQALLDEGSVRDHHEAINVVASGAMSGKNVARIVIPKTAWEAYEQLAGESPHWRTDGLYD